ncbi:MAG: GntR family transcriptional regulator [Cyclobacteriaceae bacterium]
MENKSISLEINEDSSLPKYKQVVKSIVENIETGAIQYGQKLPSINQLSFDYYLSRDTVEKAYRDLKKNGVIESVKGKGYYVSNSAPESKLKVLVVFNKLSAYKKEIYNALADSLKDKAQIDFFIYHCDFNLFDRVIDEHRSGYNYYIIMPHFIDYDKSAFLKTLKKISSNKLIVLDHLVEGLDKFFGAVYQDFKLDIYDAMEMGLDVLKKYQKLILSFPVNTSYPYPNEIVIGFRRFCAFNNFQFEVIPEIVADTKIEKNAAYVVIEENDLVNFIRNIRAAGLQLTKDVGVLSYNDTALKEVLADGISVITTDFQNMGKLAADMILNQKGESVKNDFKLISRKSL